MGFSLLVTKLEGNFLYTYTVGKLIIDGVIVVGTYHSFPVFDHQLSPSTSACEVLPAIRATGWCNLPPVPDQPS